MREMVLGWAYWISGSALTNWIAIHEWVVPTSQSIHILAIGVVFTSALMISLRLLDVGRSSRSVSQLAGALLPLMYGGLVVLLLSGGIQIVAEPTRQFVTPAFWWKMLMVVLVVLLTVWFGRTVRRNAGRWDAAASRPAGGRVFALVWMGLFVGIVFCGRFIGYTWNFYV